MNISRYVVIAVAVAVFIFDIAFRVSARPVATPAGARTYEIGKNGPQAPRDFAKDASTYLQAAKLGDAEAMLKLAYLYGNYQFAQHDDAQALQWYLRAAELGQSKAMFMVGTRYWSGNGVPQDYAEAYKWIALAEIRSTGGDMEAARTARSAIARGMSPSMIEEAQKRTREWSPVVQKRRM